MATAISAATPRWGEMMTIDLPTVDDCLDLDGENPEDPDDPTEAF